MACTDPWAEKFGKEIIIYRKPGRRIQDTGKTHWLGFDLTTTYFVNFFLVKTNFIIKNKKNYKGSLGSPSGREAWGDFPFCPY